MKDSNFILLKDILPELNIKNFQIEILQNGKIAAGYRDATYGNTALVLINEDFSIDHTYKFNNASLQFVGFGDSTNKNEFALVYNCGNNMYLYKLDSNLKAVKQISVNGTCQKICSNDKFICLFQIDKVNIYDWELNFIKDVGQSAFPTGLYYFKSFSDVSIVMKHSTLYLCYPQRFDIMNIETGKLIKSVVLSNDKDQSILRIGSKGDLYLWSKSQKKIFHFNGAGDYLGELEADKDLIDFIVYENGKFLFFK